MVVAKKYVLIKAFDGFPSDENIALQEETLPSLQDGGNSGWKIETTKKWRPFCRRIVPNIFERKSLYLLHIALTFVPKDLVENNQNKSG